MNYLPKTRDINRLLDEIESFRAGHLTRRRYTGYVA